MVDVGGACWCGEACSRPDVFGAVWSAVFWWLLFPARSNSSNWWRQHWWPCLSATQHDFNNTGIWNVWKKQQLTNGGHPAKIRTSNNNHSKRIPN
uniref:Secreted protein n=1 Tax=Meloidogyne incognita TaxID=6306 RepID=A0A914MHR4_MELIC